MYNYYRQEQAQKDKQKECYQIDSEQQRFLVKQKRDQELVEKYDRRVRIFLKKMQQEPFQIYDSMYKKSRRKPRDNSRRWLNASAMHSLDVYENKQPVLVRSNKNNLSCVQTQIETDEMKLLDEFDPNKIISQRNSQKSNHFVFVDQQVLHNNLKINTDRLPKLQLKKKKPKLELGRLYFNGLKALTVQGSQLDDQESDNSLSEQARVILLKCNVMNTKLC